MSQSSRISNEAIVAIHNKLGECRELGDDPAIWRLHACQSFQKMFDSQLVVVGEMIIPRNGPPKGNGTIEWGWHNGLRQDGWNDAMKTFAMNPQYSVYLTKVIERAAKDQEATCSRKELITDREWNASRERELYYDAIGIDACIHSFCPVGYGPPCDKSGMIISRVKGERQFNQRELNLLKYLHSELSKLVGTKLCGFNEPAPTDLAPRVRDVLKLVLEGEGDKQIAKKLVISIYTVNQYVKVIFRHFRVCSRPELMARWLKRGWTNSAAWATTE